jgi:mono/diheme cytochrome c family protein
MDQAMTYLVLCLSRTAMRARVTSLLAIACGCALAWGPVTWAGGQPPAPTADTLSLGRHLAAECTACHGAALLIGLLDIYASGVIPDGRPANAAMVSVAQSLDPAQRAAVAAYFAQQRPVKVAP